MSLLVLGTNCHFWGTKWKWPSFLTPSGQALQIYHYFNFNGNYAPIQWLTCSQSSPTTQKFIPSHGRRRSIRSKLCYLFDYGLILFFILIAICDWLLIVLTDNTQIAGFTSDASVVRTGFTVAASVYCNLKLTELMSTYVHVAILTRGWIGRAAGPSPKRTRSQSRRSPNSWRYVKYWKALLIVI